MGNWTIDIVSHEVVKETDGWKGYYVILVRLRDRQLTSPNHRNGWVISRTLTQIKELVHQLGQVSGL